MSIATKEILEEHVRRGECYELNDQARKRYQNDAEFHARVELGYRIADVALARTAADPLPIWAVNLIALGTLMADIGMEVIVVGDPDLGFITPQPDHFRKM